MNNSPHALRESWDEIPAVDAVARGQIAEVRLEIKGVKDAVSVLGEVQKDGNRQTILAVAAIGFIGVLVTVIGTWVGQRAATQAGASQAHIGAAQAVASAMATPDEIKAAEKKGREIEHDRWIQWETDHPPPIVKPQVFKRVGR